MPFSQNLNFTITFFSISELDDLHFLEKVQGLKGAMKTPKLVVSKVKVQHRVKSPGFYQKTKTNSVNPFFSGYQNSVHQAQFPGGLSSPRDKWKKLSQKAVQAKFFGEDKMSPWTNGPQNIWSLVLDKQLTNSLHSFSPKNNSAKSDFVLSEAQFPKAEYVTVEKIPVQSQKGQNMSPSKGSQAKESKSKISKVKVAKVQAASAPKQTVQSKMQSKKSGPKRPWH